MPLVDMQACENSIVNSGYTSLMPNNLEKAINAYFALAFKEVDSKGMLCNLSLREYLGMDRTVYAINPENINSLALALTNYLWLRLVPNDSIQNHSSIMLKSLIFPCLFSRNLIIRRLAVQDFDRVCRKLYLLFPSILNHVALNNGLTSHQCSMVVETTNDKKTKNKPYAAIHYVIESKDCYIASLKVHHKKEGQKFGKLLLIAAIIDAKCANASTLALSSSLKGIPLYISFGFVPVDVCNDSAKQQWWNTLSLPVQIKISEQIHNKELMLDIGNIDCDKHLIKALNFNRQAATLSPLVEMPIPQEAYSFNLLSRHDQLEVS